METDRGVACETELFQMVYYGWKWSGHAQLNLDKSSGWGVYEVLCMSVCDSTLKSASGRRFSCNFPRQWLNFQLLNNHNTHTHTHRIILSTGSTSTERRSHILVADLVAQEDLYADLKTDMRRSFTSGRKKYTRLSLWRLAGDILP